jgi:hypothetical protein
MEMAALGGPALPKGLTRLLVSFVLDVRFSYLFCPNRGLIGIFRYAIYRDNGMRITTDVSSTHCRAHGRIL